MSSPQQYVYVLSTGEDLTYADLTFLSVLSLKYCEPAARVNVVTDVSTRAVLKQNDHPLIPLVDGWHEFEVAGNSAERSRLLKTTLRSRIAGQFVFLDADTVVVDSPAELFKPPHEIAMVQDQHEGHAYPGFPDWLIPHFQRLGWSWPTVSYYNSGVIVVPDDVNTHRLFVEWHERWAEFSRLGMLYDQPALNYAIQRLETPVRELPQKFNAMVRVDERYRRDAVILHFFYTAPDDPKSGYTRLLRDIAEKRALSGREVVERMTRREALYNPDSVRRQLHAGNFVGAAILWFRKKIRSIFRRQSASNNAK